MISRVCEGATIDSTLVQVAEKHDGKAISDKTTTEKAESENVVAKSVSAQQVLTKKVVVEKAVEKKMVITKYCRKCCSPGGCCERQIPQPGRSSVLSKSLRTEEDTSQQETHMGTSQHMHSRRFWIISKSDVGDR